MENNYHSIEHLLSGLMQTFKNIMSFNHFLKSMLRDFCFQEDEIEMYFSLLHKVQIKSLDIIYKTNINGSERWRKEGRSVRHLWTQNMKWW